MKFWPVIMLHVLSSIISWVMLSNPLTQLYALLIVLIYNSHALFNTKSPSTFAILRNKNSIYWRLKSTLSSSSQHNQHMYVYVCIFIYLFFHPFFICLQNACLVLPSLLPTCLFHEVPCGLSLKNICAGTRCKIKLKSPGALRSEAKWKCDLFYCKWEGEFWLLCQFYSGKI